MSMFTLVSMGIQISLYNFFLKKLVLTSPVKLLIMIPVWFLVVGINGLSEFA